MINYVRAFILILAMYCNFVYAHDTTHIHPLISAKISDLIFSNDTGSAYKDIYELLPDEDKNPDVPVGVSQRLYWGTDFDLNTNISKTHDWLLKDQIGQFDKYNNVIDGVVQEDVPSGKVLDHFYHADSDPLKLVGLTAPLITGGKSSERAMAFFNEIKGDGGI